MILSKILRKLCLPVSTFNIFLHMVNNLYMFLSLLVEKNPNPNDHVKFQIDEKKYYHLMPEQITTIID